MTPYTMLCCSNGDLWKRFPDGSVCPIEDEDDLRDVNRIAALEPIRSELARITGTTGELIAYLPCSECNGTGRYEGPDVLWCSDWNRDEQGRMYREAPVWPSESSARSSSSFVGIPKQIAPGRGQPIRAREEVLL